MKDKVDLIKLYLNDVNLILSKFKLKVGQPLEDKSWIANIPESGHYFDVGITKFKRHGIGIYVEFEGKNVDFNFYDSNFLEHDDSNKFITIDIGFLAEYIESLEIKNEQWTEYNLLNEEMGKLTEKGILMKIENKYYLSEDLEAYALK